MLAGLARLWRRSVTNPARVHVFSAPHPTRTFEADVDAAGLSTIAWCRQRRQHPVLYANVTPETLATLRERHVDRVHRTIEVADRAVRHEFELLGSGPYVPADPDRPARNGYTPIDWHLDPLRRLRFSRTVPNKQWDLPKMQPGNADVKYPWELSRCQHWATLGQAFLFTEDDRFAIEIARELDDFCEANPTGAGVNWTCTMDVGLRAVSWAIGLELVRTSESLDEAFWSRAYTALYDHGAFICDNLENNYEVTSNHFVSNLLGLFFVGTVFGDLPQGSEWVSFSRRAIEHEMRVQVLDDGADYESSIPYHRLVAELFLGATRLADCQDAPMSAAFRARVRKMVGFLAAVTRPDGLMPQVGDSDDGRLHVFEGYGTTTPQDGRHLFGPAGQMFDDPTWFALGGDAGRWEAAWWGFGAAGMTGSSQREPLACLYRDAGIAVARAAAAHYLLVTNGTVGTGGFGNHKHNDLLSFEYHHGGTPLILDPGTYVYTSDVDARNRFRGTAYHNTLMVDGVEQNELRPGFLFRVFEISNPESVSFHDRDGIVEYVGRHHGYECLPEPVTHERTFRFLKSSGALEIVDRLKGRGRHDLRWHFHLAPGISAEPAGSTVVSLADGERRWRLTLPPGLQMAVNPADYSPTYGVRVACLAIDLSLQVVLSGELTLEFSVGP